MYPETKNMNSDFRQLHFRPCHRVNSTVSPEYGWDRQTEETTPLPVADNGGIDSKFNIIHGGRGDRLATDHGGIYAEV